MISNSETLKMIFGEAEVEKNFINVLRFISENPDGYRQKVLDAYLNKKNEDTETCRECGGKCCLKSPCHLSPMDIEDLSYNGLKKYLKRKKYISILRFSRRICEVCLRTLKVEGPYYYVLRIRTRGTGIAATAAQIDKDDHCMLLTPEGCKIKYEERPLGAKLLIPRTGQTQCNQLYSMDDCLYDWNDYQDVLEKLFKYFEKIERKNVHL